MSVVTAPQPSFPRKPVRITVAQFNRMGDMGWFEGRRPFLLDGIIWEQGPMDPPHAIALGLVQHALQSTFGTGWWVRGQSPLHVDEYDDPFPDFAVVTGAPRDYLGRHPTTGALVVEISDTTLRVDTTEKAERFATAAIADYWVLDLNGRQLIVFRDPAPLPAGLGATAYRTQFALGPADRVSPLAAPNVSILVGDLLP
jgi:Uma2 family endonuclease